MASLPKPGKMPEPEGAGQFIKAADIGKLGTKAKLKIVGMVNESGEFHDFTLSVEFGSASFALPVKYTSGNYRRLFDKFGADAEDWKGTINVEVKEHKGKEYVAIV